MHQLGPIRKLEECLAEIRAKSFLPDATRSGLFSDAGHNDLILMLSRAFLDVVQMGMTGQLIFSDSDSEDSRDDEHAFEEQQLNEEAMDHVVGPWG